MEQWKDIPELGGKYKCSSYGRIGVVFKKFCRITNGTIGSHGYMVLCLASGKKKRVHRLVGELFIDNPMGKEQINHKDFDKQNNRADNLEWVTQLENLAHAHSDGRLGRGRKK